MCWVQVGGERGEAELYEQRDEQNMEDNRVMDLGSWWSEAVAVSVAFCTLLSSINVAIIPVLNSVV